MNVKTYDPPMGVEIYDSTTQGNKISNFELEVGSSKNLYAVVTSTGMADQSVKWTSNNPNIVDVDENGVVTARTRGTAIVSAESVADITKNAQCNVTVKKSDFTASCVLQKQWYSNNLFYKQYNVNIMNQKAGNNYSFSINVQTKNAIYM